jgi:hypothetical protein
MVFELARFGVVEKVMPHRRQVHKGSFGSHFDELVARFPAGETALSSADRSSNRAQELQDKIDIHALLFERAWKLDRQG